MNDREVDELVSSDMSMVAKNMAVLAKKVESRKIWLAQTGGHETEAEAKARAEAEAEAKAEAKAEAVGFHYKAGWMVDVNSKEAFDAAVEYAKAKNRLVRFLLSTGLEAWV